MRLFVQPPAEQVRAPGLPSRGLAAFGAGREAGEPALGLPPRCPRSQARLGLRAEDNEAGSLLGREQRVRRFDESARKGQGLDRPGYALPLRCGGFIHPCAASQSSNSSIQ